MHRSKQNQWDIWLQINYVVVLYVDISHILQSNSLILYVSYHSNVREFETSVYLSFFMMRIVIVMGFSSKNLFPLPQLSNLSGIFVEHIKKIPPFYHNVACFSSYCSTILDRTPYILIIEEKI